jgi:hypothetical protein
MVHPIMSKTISSYKRLMNDPLTAEVWQTASGKDFQGMTQGCNKIGQRGTKAMFVMTHDEIVHALRTGVNIYLHKPHPQPQAVKGRCKQNLHHGGRVI